MQSSFTPLAVCQLKEGRDPIFGCGMVLVFYRCPLDWVRMGLLRLHCEVDRTLVGEDVHIVPLFESGVDDAPSMRASYQLRDSTG